MCLPSSYCRLKPVNPRFTEFLSTVCIKTLPYSSPNTKHSMKIVFPLSIVIIFQVRFSSHVYTCTEYPTVQKQPYCTVPHIDHFGVLCFVTTSLLVTCDCYQFHLKLHTDFYTYLLHLDPFVLFIVNLL